MPRLEYSLLEPCSLPLPKCRSAVISQPAASCLLSFASRPCRLPAGGQFAPVGPFRVSFFPPSQPSLPCLPLFDNPFFVLELLESKGWPAAPAVAVPLPDQPAGKAGREAIFFALTADCRYPCRQAGKPATLVRHPFCHKGAAAAGRTDWPAAGWAIFPLLLCRPLLWEVPVAGDIFPCASGRFGVF